MYGMFIFLAVVSFFVVSNSIYTQKAPSFIEGNKISKVENRLIANQELLKDTIIRYIKIKNITTPTLTNVTLTNIKSEFDLNFTNPFDVNGYTISKITSTEIEIKTKINDANALKYFQNSSKLTGTTICTIDECTTKYTY